jgi:hypothetical protein
LPRGSRRRFNARSCPVNRTVLPEDARSGTVRWARGHPCRAQRPVWSGGPEATPAGRSVRYGPVDRRASPEDAKSGTARWVRRHPAPGARRPARSGGPKSISRGREVRYGPVGQKAPPRRMSDPPGTTRHTRQWCQGQRARAPCCVRSQTEPEAVSVRGHAPSTCTLYWGRTTMLEARWQ